MHKYTIEQDINYLVINKQNFASNILLRILLVFLCFSILSPILVLFFWWSFPRTITLNCTRFEPKQGSCQIQEKIFDIQTNAIQVIQIKEAKVREEKDNSEESSSIYYQIELQSKNVKQDFGNSYNNKAEAEQIVKQINAFINSPNQQTFQVVQQEGHLGVLLCVILIFSTTVIFSFYRHIREANSKPIEETWNFNRTAQKLIVTTKTNFQPIVQTEYSLFDIIALEIEPENFVRRLNLISNSGDKIILDFSDDGTFTIFHTSLKKFINFSDKVIKFLDLDITKIIIIHKVLKIGNFHEKLKFQFSSEDNKLTVVKCLASGEEIITESLLSLVSLQMDDSKKDGDGDTIYTINVIFDSGEKFELWVRDEEFHYWRGLFAELFPSVKLL